MGSAAKAGQALDNFNHLVMLRVRSVATANLLTEQTPQVNTYCLMPVSGVTDTAAQGTGVDFTSRNDDILNMIKTQLIGPSDVLELPQGEAFALLEGNRRYKLRIPLADPIGDPFIPESILKVAHGMKASYRTGEHWAANADWLSQYPLSQYPSGITWLPTTPTQPHEQSQVPNFTGLNASTVQNNNAVISDILGGH
jgi:hypothetical protein